jgi:UDP-N-acetylglucosamine 2-epimerase (non-hydrolysing)
MREICRALRHIHDRVGDARIVFPVHLNPGLRDTVYGELAGLDRLELMPPVDYLTMIALLERAYLVLTDSGGIQEEAAALGRPVLVLRDKTERTEGLEAGVARLVGTDAETITREAVALLTDPTLHARMAQASDCYGDGRAGVRIAEALCRRDRT